MFQVFNKVCVCVLLLLESLHVQLYKQALFSSCRLCRATLSPYTDNVPNIQVVSTRNIIRQSAPWLRTPEPPKNIIKSRQKGTKPNKQRSTKKAMEKDLCKEDKKKRKTSRKHNTSNRDNWLSKGWVQSETHTRARGLQSERGECPQDWIMTITQHFNGKLG